MTTTVTGIKALVGRKVTKKTKFVDSDVVISKLSVAQVMEIQQAAQAVEQNPESSGIEILKNIVRLSVEGASELTDEDFASFPMDELNKLSNEIMSFSGIKADAGK